MAPTIASWIYHMVQLPVLSDVPMIFQEFEKFNKFANSLLARASKLTDSAQLLESEIEHIKEKGDEAPDVKRAKALET